MPDKSNLNGATPDNTEPRPLVTKGTIVNKERPPRLQQKSLWRVIKEIHFEYCSNTSLHGVQYFGQRRPWKEIYFWMFFYLLSICFCSITIQKLYMKWNETPVIVTFSEHYRPISFIPFPAITICSETKRNILGRQDVTYYELFRNLSSHITAGTNFQPNITLSEFQEFLTLLHVCDPSDIDVNIPRLSTLPIDYIEILNRMLPDAQIKVPWCKWAKIEDACDDLFVKTYTEEGVCVTFNGLNATDLYRENTVQYQVMGLQSTFNTSGTRLKRSLSWSLEKGYSPRAPLETYPARVLSASSKAALTVFLAELGNYLEFGCSGAAQGFKIVLHTPDDVPLLSKRFVRLSLGKEVMIAVKPNMITTSDGISGYDARKRGCYLNHEQPLKFFKVYSENNCEMECLTNYTLARCGCVKFSMPRTPDMPVCGEDKILCYNTAENELLLENFDDGDNDNDGCNCMPSCTSLEYDLELSQADFDMKHWADVMHVNLTADIRFSRLSVFFKDNEFITSKRAELFGFSDLLANCGGVCGLFMGFSILSIVELLYHFTLRLWTNLNGRREEQQQHVHTTSQIS